MLRFQSTLPLRGVTCAACGSKLAWVFQSTLPLRGVTTRSSSQARPAPNFNPHSPCRERLSTHNTSFFRFYFNPCSPCGERPSVMSPTKPPLLFQSTLPLRGATGTVRAAHNHRRISIHVPPAGATCRPFRQCRVDGISIHVPLAGSDKADGTTWICLIISIHTPLAGSDFRAFRDHRGWFNFNPHSPCGE